MVALYPKGEACIRCGETGDVYAILGTILCEPCYVLLWTQAVELSVKKIIDQMVEEQTRGTSSIKDPIGLLQWHKEQA